MRRPFAALVLAVLLAAPALGPAGDAVAQRGTPAVSFSAAADSSVLALLESGFRAGNPGALLAHAADPVDVAIYGHGASYSRSQAALVLLDFFRRHPPAHVSLREEVAGEDRRSVIGQYRDASGGPPSAVFVRLRARDGHWEIRSIRIERAGRR